MTRTTVLALCALSFLVCPSESLAAQQDSERTPLWSRLINGVEVVLQEYEATLAGISYTFLGHYYSDSHGTIQVTAGTYSNLFEEHRDTLEKFVAGLVIDQ